MNDVTDVDKRSKTSRIDGISVHYNTGMYVVHIDRLVLQGYPLGYNSV